VVRALLWCGKKRHAKFLIDGYGVKAITGVPSSFTVGSQALVAILEQRSHWYQNRYTYRCRRGAVTERRRLASRVTDHAHVCDSHRLAEFARRVLGQAVKMPQSAAPPEWPRLRPPVTRPLFAVYRPSLRALHGAHFRRAEPKDRGPFGRERAESSVGGAEWIWKFRILAVDESPAIGVQHEDPTGEPRVLQGRLCTRAHLVGRILQGDAQERWAST
jgi:hypothetical protein